MNTDIKKKFCKVLFSYSSFSERKKNVPQKQIKQTSYGAPPAIFKYQVKLTPYLTFKTFT